MASQLRIRCVPLGAVIVFAIVLLAMAGCDGGGTPTPTTTPSPSPSPTVTPGSSPAPTGEPFTPEGVSDSRFGLTWISSFYTDELAQNNPNREQDAVRAGVTWDRWDFRRGPVFKDGLGSFIFDHDDITYTGAIAHDEIYGLETLAIINGPVPNPSAPDLDDWRDYVDAIVTNYKDNVDAWEIGNEGGLSHQDGLSANNYVNILRITCEVLYEHNQGDKVVLLGSPNHPITLNSNTYWDQVLHLIRSDSTDKNYGRLPDCLDAVGGHVYGRPIFSYDAIVHSYSRAGWNPGVWITEHGVMWQEDGYFPHANKYRQASYVVQQYVLALTGFEAAGIDELNSNRAKTFYHRFADANPDNPNDRYWGLMDYYRSDPYYPSYDAVSLITSLFSGAHAPENQNSDPDEFELVRHYRFEKSGQYIHVLWARDQAVPGWGFPADGTDSGNCATLYYQPGDGSGSGGEPSEHGNDGRFWKASIPLGPSDRFILDLPASGETWRGTNDDPYYDWPMIGGPVYILVETNESCEESRAPEGKACLICENGRVIGTDFIVYDEHSGLDTGAAQFSPQRSWDLSETEPGVQYAYTSDEYPPAGSVGTFTLTNKAGLYITQTLSHPLDYCKGGGGGSPGGDHPDDNYSAAAASSPIPPGEFFVLPRGARFPSQVAILRRGASHQLWQLLLQLGEPGSCLEVDFDPAEQYPVLIVIWIWLIPAPGPTHLSA